MPKILDRSHKKNINNSVSISTNNNGSSPYITNSEYIENSEPLNSTTKKSTFTSTSKVNELEKTDNINLEPSKLINAQLINPKRARLQRTASEQVPLIAKVVNNEEDEEEEIGINQINKPKKRKKLVGSKSSPTIDNEPTTNKLSNKKSADGNIKQLSKEDEEDNINLSDLQVGEILLALQRNELEEYLLEQANSISEVDNKLILPSDKDTEPNEDKEEIVSNDGWLWLIQFLNKLINNQLNNVITINEQHQQLFIKLSIHTITIITGLQPTESIYNSNVKLGRILSKLNYDDSILNSLIEMIIEGYLIYNLLTNNSNNTRLLSISINNKINKLHKLFKEGDERELELIRLNYLLTKLDDNNTYEINNLLLTIPNLINHLELTNQIFTKLMTSINIINLSPKEISTAILDLNPTTKDQFHQLANVYYQSWSISSSDHRILIEDTVLFDLLDIYLNHTDPQLDQRLINTPLKSTTPADMSKIELIYKVWELLILNRTLNRGIDIMINRVFYTPINNSLSAANQFVKYNAVTLLGLFYPIYDIKAPKKVQVNTIDDQFKKLLNIMRGIGFPFVRARSIESICKILAHFWSTFNNTKLNIELVGELINKQLTDDTILDIPMAILTGLEYILVQCKESNNIIIPQITTKTTLLVLRHTRDHVRIKFMDLLLRVQPNSLVDLTSHIITTLSEGTNNSPEVLKRASALLLRTQFSLTDNNYNLNKCNYLLKKSVVAAKVFYAHLVSILPKTNQYKIMVINLILSLLSDDPKLISINNLSICAILLDDLSSFTNESYYKPIINKLTVDCLLSIVNNNINNLKFIGAWLIMITSLPNSNNKILSNFITNYISKNNIEDEELLLIYNNYLMLNGGEEYFDDLINQIINPQNNINNSAKLLLELSRLIASQSGELSKLLNHPKLNILMDYLKPTNINLDLTKIKLYYRLRVKQINTSGSNNDRNLMIRNHIDWAANLNTNDIVILNYILTSFSDFLICGFVFDTALCEELIKRFTSNLSMIVNNDKLAIKLYYNWGNLILQTIIKLPELLLMNNNNLGELLSLLFNSLLRLVKVLSYINSEDPLKVELIEALNKPINILLLLMLNRLGLDKFNKIILTRVMDLIFFDSVIKNFLAENSPDFLWGDDITLLNVILTDPRPNIINDESIDLAELEFLTRYKLRSYCQPIELLSYQLDNLVSKFDTLPLLLQCVNYGFMILERFLVSNEGNDEDEDVVELSYDKVDGIFCPCECGRLSNSGNLRKPYQVLYRQDVEEEEE